MFSHCRNLGIALVNGPLRVSDRRDVLDDDNMVRVFILDRLTSGAWHSRLVQQVVGVHHIVHDIALELTLRTQVVPIVVTKVVVGRDGEWLDTSIHEELGKHGLELGLARLEIVATDEGLFGPRELDDTKDDGDLGDR